jgi:hypothetical protein
MTKEAQEAVAVKAVALIKESGFAITLTHPDNGAYDPDTGYTPSPDVLSHGFAIEDESEVDSVPTSIAEKVLKTILAVDIDRPVPDEDKMTFKGETFQVLGQDPLETGEVLFFYTIYLGA